MKWEKLFLVAGSALMLVACGKAEPPAPATVSATSAPSATSTAAPVTYVTLPDMYGQSADVATAKLEDLGLTNVELASSNTEHSSISRPADWKVVGMKPGAETVVRSDDPVILTVVKIQ